MDFHYPMGETEILAKKKKKMDKRKENYFVSWSPRSNSLAKVFGKFKLFANHIHLFLQVGG